MIAGLDVSHFQGSIDWTAVANGDIRFAWIKATEGRAHIDPAFARNWAGAARAGLLRGAYHFARPGTGARVQADFFAAAVGELVPGDLPAALDLEEQDGQSGAQLLDWTLIFVSRIEELTGRECVIYTGRLWRETMGNPVIPALATNPLWTARYSTSEPEVPATWARWDFWQHSQSGVVPGIAAPVDLDVWRGDIEELRALAQLAPAAAAG